MCGWFTIPRRTSRALTTALVRDAVEGRAVRPHEAACSAVSGKSLARSPRGCPALPPSCRLGVVVGDAQDDRHGLRPARLGVQAVWRCHRGERREGVTGHPWGCEPPAGARTRASPRASRPGHRPGTPTGATTAPNCDADGVVPTGVRRRSWIGDHEPRWQAPAGRVAAAIPVGPKTGRSRWPRRMRTPAGANETR